MRDDPFEVVSWTDTRRLVKGQPGTAKQFRSRGVQVIAVEKVERVSRALTVEEGAGPLQSEDLHEAVQDGLRAGSRMVQRSGSMDGVDEVFCEALMQQAPCDAVGVGLNVLPVEVSGSEVVPEFMGHDGNKWTKVRGCPEHPETVRMAIEVPFPLGADAVFGEPLADDSG
ncbi:hypothetical protein DFI_18810 (plasmid) [Deinococcus ficus]|uniref:Uncharacterized protein n=1 Tax=Deinococcus ficus TaxID=317577 RepID=A0A221T318_9DEIO|nr:hypothetical protein DFI_18810 [Deinococcus ficus]